MAYFPRLVFHIKPSEAGPFEEIRENPETELRRSGLSAGIQDLPRRASRILYVIQASTTHNP